MTRSFGFQLVALLCNNIVFVENVRHVTVPNVYAVTGDDAIIKCYVRFTERDIFVQETITFEMLNTNLRCQINNWRPCSPFYVDHGAKPDNFSCGCLSRTDKTRFIFYLYLRACPKVLDKTRYQCTLVSGNLLASDGQLKLIDFTKRPKSTVTKCAGDSVHFPWEYNPRDFQTKFVIHHITWMFYPSVGDPSLIATVNENTVYISDNAYFGDRARIYQVALKQTIPRLMVRSLRTSDTGIFQTEITFMSENALQRYNEEKSSWQFKKTFGLPLGNRTTGRNRVSNSGPDYKEQSDFFYDDANMVTQDDVDVRRKKVLVKKDDGVGVDFLEKEEEMYDNETTMPLVDFVKNTEPVLRSSAMLYIVEPPPENLTLVFKVLSRSDEQFLYCSVMSFRNETSFAHINFVIKHADTVLGSSSNDSSLLLKISKESPTDNYFCELSGDAFRCLHQKPKNSTRKLYISNLLKFETIAPHVDVPFTFMDIIFVLEGVTCVFLMIWNCTLFVWHLSFLSSRTVKREERKLSDALKELEVKHMRRLSQVRAMRNHPQFRVDKSTTESTTEPSSITEEETSIDSSTYKEVSFSSRQDRSRTSRRNKISRNDNNRRENTVMMLNKKETIM